jgi:hypothetical protein
MASAVDRILEEARRLTPEERVRVAAELLASLKPSSAPRVPFRTRSVDLGGLKVASIDNVSEALAIAEDPR